jgi:hypothetical protein
VIAMSDEYYYWNCTNSECQSLNNRVSKKTVEDTINRKARLHVYCAVCGFAPSSVKIKVTDYKDSAVKVCECIPFLGEESRLPLRKDNNGLYVDCNLKEHEIDYFLDLGIHPDLYFKWIFHNKPKKIDLLKYQKG